MDKPNFKPSVHTAAKSLQGAGNLYAYMGPRNAPYRRELIYHLTGEWVMVCHATTDRLVEGYMKAAGVTSFTCFRDAELQCVAWADTFVKTYPCSV